MHFILIHALPASCSNLQIDMAAYGAVASLLKTLDSAVSVLVPLRPQIESLRDRASSLQYSLENCFGKISDPEIYEKSLEAKIRDAAFKAEDLIASKMVDLSAVDETRPVEVADVQRDSLPEDEDLREMIQEIGCIVDEVKKIEYDHGVEGQRQLARNVQSVASSSSGGKISICSGEKVVSRFEKDVEEIRSRLYNNLLKRETVPIVGMGGIGKTTLARRVYDSACFDDHFDICAWTTVSQVYSPSKVLVNLLDSGKMLKKEMNGMENRILSRKKMSELSDRVLGEVLCRSLWYRRYLIIMDDVWEEDIWNAVQKYLPDNNNGSRVLLTTRLSKVALHANSSSSLHQMSLLNKDDSWNLLCNVVFGENDCPNELESIGKEIAENCKGLPLVLGVIGGFLSKVSRSNEAWICVANNLNSIVTKDDEQCMEILSLSYKHLPHHLRPCFLYMAMLPQDHVIRMDELSCLWATEGFLQSGKPESVEVLAEKYIEDLVERNLIFLHRWPNDNLVKTCSIHDMLWNFCTQRAQKESFLHVVKCPGDAVLHEGFGVQRRRVRIHLDHHNDQPDMLFDIMARDSSVHSLVCSGSHTVQSPQINLGHHMLLKVLDLFIVELIDFPDIITRLLTCGTLLSPTMVHFLHRYPGFRI